MRASSVPISMYAGRCPAPSNAQSSGANAGSMVACTRSPSCPWAKMRTVSFLREKYSIPSRSENMIPSV